jgi:hypothetical protein
MTYRPNNPPRTFPPAARARISGFLPPRWMRHIARLLILTLATHPALGLAQGVTAAPPATQVTLTADALPTVHHVQGCDANKAPRLSAVAPRLNAVASRLNAVASRLITVAPKLIDVAPKLITVAPRLIDVAPRLSAIASSFNAVAPRFNPGAPRFNATDPCKKDALATANNLRLNRQWDNVAVPFGNALYTGGTALAAGVIAEALGRDGVTAARAAQNAAQNNKQMHPDEVKFLSDKDRVQRYIDYMAGKGVVLTESEAQIRLDQYGAAMLDKDWTGIYGRDATTETFIRQEALDANVYYRDNQGNLHQMFAATEQEYLNASINLRPLLDAFYLDEASGKRNFDPREDGFRLFDTSLDGSGPITNYLRNIALLVDGNPVATRLDFVEQYRDGQKEGYSDSDSAGLLTDLKVIGNSLLGIPGYVKDALLSDEIGMYDDGVMKLYFQNLLELQHRGYDAGYVSELDWTTQQRLMWESLGLGAAAGPILGGVARVGGTLYSKVSGKLVPITETMLVKAGGAKGGVGVTETVTSGGTANAATYPLLKNQLVNENLANIAAQDSRLAAAVKGSGTSNPNFSIGIGTTAEANTLGQAWVGDGATLVSNQVACPGCLISADRTMIYRPPQPKSSPFSTTGVQANFVKQTPDGVVLSNGHLNITP